MVMGKHGYAELSQPAKPTAIVRTIPWASIAIVLILRTGVAGAQTVSAPPDATIDAASGSPTLSATETPTQVESPTDTAQPWVDGPVTLSPAITETIAPSGPAAPHVGPTPRPSTATDCPCPCNAVKAEPLQAPIDLYQRKPGYGWQIAVTDLANVSVHFIAGFANDKKWVDGPIPYTFAGTYLLSGPIIHLANGRPGYAAKSLGVRVVAPLVLALVGGLTGPSEKMAAGGLALGFASAAVFDAAVLGRGDYVGVQTSRRFPMLRASVERGGRSVLAQLAWTY